MVLHWVDKIEEKLQLDAQKLETLLNNLMRKEI